MAKKKRSKVSKRSVPLPGMVRVNSRAYGVHDRAKRGTNTPVKLNEAFQRNAAGMSKAIPQAKVIFDLLDPYRKDLHDGTWWNRLLIPLKTHCQGDQPPDYAILEGSELNEKYRLDRLVPELSAEVKAKKREIDVQLKYQTRPSFPVASITMYTISVICIFIERKTLKATREIQDFEKLKCKDKVVPLVATMPLPKTADVVVVCVKVAGIYDDEGLSHSGKMKGMRIVKVQSLKSKV